MKHNKEHGTKARKRNAELVLKNFAKEVDKIKAARIKEVK